METVVLLVKIPIDKLLYVLAVQELSMLMDFLVKLVKTNV